MRHPRRELTKQTKRALEDQVKQVACEMEVSSQYLYAILANTEADPYANFRTLFRAISRCDVYAAKTYLDDLSAIFQAELKRQHPQGKCTGELCEVHKELSDVIDAALSGKPREVQTKEIAEAIDSLEARAGLLVEGEERSKQR